MQRLTCVYQFTRTEFQPPLSIFNGTLKGSGSLSVEVWTPPKRAKWPHEDANSKKDDVWATERGTYPRTGLLGIQILSKGASSMIQPAASSVRNEQQMDLMVWQTDRSRTQMSKYWVYSAKTYWMTKKKGLRQNMRAICECLCVSLNPL